VSLALHVLGSSGSWPAPCLPTSGYVLSDRSTRVVMELGFGTMTRLADPLDVDGVLVSHRHPDHCADVLALYHLWAYGPDRRQGVPLLAPPSTIEALSGFIAAEPGSRFFEVFDPNPVAHGDRRQVGSLLVDFVAVDHSVDTVGMRVESRGRSIFFTGDTGAREEWWRRVPPSDLVLAEASWQGDGDGGDFAQHLTAAQAGGVAAAIGCDRLVVTHVKPGLDPVRSVGEAQETFPGSVLHADPGLTIEV
jgi:ribonuclease BN (tRNA processing enzyme)